MIINNLIDPHRRDHLESPQIVPHDPPILDVLGLQILPGVKIEVPSPRLVVAAGSARGLHGLVHEIQEPAVDEEEDVAREEAAGGGGALEVARAHHGREISPIDRQSRTRWIVRRWLRKAPLLLPLAKNLPP